MDIECCVEEYSEALLAAEYGATRIELCSALRVGGLTPSFGLASACAQIVPTHVMIRPREGGFCYDAQEIAIMKKDIEALSETKAAGVVFGALNADKTLNIQANKELISAAKAHGMEATFHRAFDFCKEPLIVLEQLIDLGFDRILTSGGCPNAFNGLEQIRLYAAQSQGRIQIMAGSGISEANVEAFLSLGISAVHFSIGKNEPEHIPGMGGKRSLQPEKIKAITRLCAG